MPALVPLPIDDVLPEIVAALRAHRAVVLKAPTGAGKTDARAAGAARRRACAARPLSARAAARRGARRGAPHRLRARLATSAARSATTCASTARPGRDAHPGRHRGHPRAACSQDDPFLEGVGAVVFDEFHERSLDADLALAMAREAQREVATTCGWCVMSATLDAGARSRASSATPASSRAPAAAIPVEIVEHLAPRATTRPPGARSPPRRAPRARRDRRATCSSSCPASARSAARRDALDGARRRARPRRGRRSTATCRPTSRTRCCGRGPRRKVVLATNVAESSVTIEGVTAVVDSGLARVLRFDPALGLDRLELGRISRASADQRAGRAGPRRARASCMRLWTRPRGARAAAAEEPEIAPRRPRRAGAELRAWGEPDLGALRVVRGARAEALAARWSCSRASARCDAGGLTAIGPRARAPAAPAARRAAAPRRAPPRRLRARRARRGAAHRARPASRGRCARARGAAARRSRVRPARPRRALLERSRRRAAAAAATPRRRARRGARTRAAGRATSSRDYARRRRVGARRPRRPCAAGRGAAARPARRVSPTASRAPARAPAAARARAGRRPRRAPRRRERGRDAELFVCARVDAGRPRRTGRGARAPGLGGRARVAARRRSSRRSGRDCASTRRSGARRGACAATRYRDLVLDESRPRAPTAEARRGARWPRPRPRDLGRALPLDDAGGRRACSPACAASRAWMPELELPALRRRRRSPTLAARRSAPAAARSTSCAARPCVDALRGQPHAPRSAPRSTARRPSASRCRAAARIRLDYEPGQPPVLAARIQELFGLADTPRIAGGRVPVLLHLLAPNQRPQQVTDDLASFWKNTYPEVRKELRGALPEARVARGSAHGHAHARRAAAALNARPPHLPPRPPPARPPPARPPPARPPPARRSSAESGHLTAPPAHNDGWGAAARPLAALKGGGRAAGVGPWAGAARYGRVEFLQLHCARIDIGMSFSC